jgi:CcmD family protein
MSAPGIPSSHLGGADRWRRIRHPSARLRAASVSWLAVVGFLCATAQCVSGAPARAQDAVQDGQHDTPDDRAQTFRAVRGPQQESVPGGRLLLMAYGIVWTLLFLYVWRLGRAHASTLRELDRLKSKLGATPEKPGEPS